MKKLSFCGIKYDKKKVVMSKMDFWALCNTLLTFNEDNLTPKAKETIIQALNIVIGYGIKK